MRFIHNALANKGLTAYVATQNQSSFVQIASSINNGEFLSGTVHNVRVRHADKGCVVS